MPDHRDFLAAETRALMARVLRLAPFVSQETMLPAAVPLPGALIGIETLLLGERVKLRRLASGYLAWLAGAGLTAPAAEAQRRFTTLRLRVNTHLSQLDLFSDAITQRSENGVGLWLSGMDIAAADALRLNPGHRIDPVPVLCYLDRGPGAAIRRVRTRLSADVINPVAVIRVPRERVAGHGIASSLFHEIGHQGAALLDLVESLRCALRRREADSTGTTRLAWHCWAAWVSEITADFWSVAKLGIGSTLGLLGVVSLPRPFVFRFTLDDPHPFPWIRVMVSAGIGEHLYPDPQWARIRRLWTRLYPLSGARPEVAGVIGALLPTIPELARVIAAHRPEALAGATVRDALACPDRLPGALRKTFDLIIRRPDAAGSTPPALRFAALGQARWDGRLTATRETAHVERMLTDWATRSTLRVAALAASRPVEPVDRPPLVPSQADPSTRAVTRHTERQGSWR